MFVDPLRGAHTYFWDVNLLLLINHPLLQSDTKPIRFDLLLVLVQLLHNRFLILECGFFFLLMVVIENANRHLLK